MCGRAARNDSSAVFVITVFVVFMAATCTAEHDGNDDTSDQLAEEDIAAIVGVVIPSLSLIAAIVGIILGIIWCKYKKKFCFRQTQSKDEHTAEEHDLGNRDTTLSAEANIPAGPTQHDKRKKKTTVNERELGVDDLAEVQGVLWEARNVWKNIGIQLKLRDDELETIEAEGKDNGEKFTKMLTVRLKKIEPLTWKMLIDVLNNKAVNMEYVAKDIVIRE